MIKEIHIKGDVKADLDLKEFDEFLLWQGYHFQRDRKIRNIEGFAENLDHFEFTLISQCRVLLNMV